MGIFDRFRRRPSIPATSKRIIRNEPGPLTAHEAWIIARPLVEKLDAGARLTLVTSGLDMGPDGRSFSWEFIYVCPRLRARALFSVAPADDAADVDNAPIALTERLNQISESELSSLTGLPIPFRDSPEVVSEFAAKGVDFVSGPSDMKIESRMAVDRQALWITYYWDEEYRTRFAAQ